MTQALERVRKAASKRKKEKFTALFHHLSVEHLEAAFFELQENAAAGVDGLTWRAYEADLECNLEDLHGRLHRGAYRPRPTGQGAVISPLLANIYLHYGLDQWAESWRRHEATGDMIIVRYADDFIIGFEYESDARRFLGAMRERLGKFALSLHPEKTRLIEFGRFAAKNRERRGLGKPETFDFLGFTFICSKSRRGKFQIKRKSRHDRMRAKLQAIKQELRRRIHQPIPVQGKWLRQVVTGYFNYHAVPTNGPALAAFRFFVTELWQRTLQRRSQQDGMAWERITRLANDWLPRPHILHPWPQARFAVTHPRWEPYAGIPLVRICAGGAQQ